MVESCETCQKHRLQNREPLLSTVVSDNRPQFSSEQFRQFATEFQFTPITSSPRYPQANGEAERAVWTIKDLRKKDRGCNRALLVYGATPLEHGLSPAQLTTGGETCLPPCPKLQPNWFLRGPIWMLFIKKDEEGKREEAKHYNLRHRARQLPKLLTGQKM